MAMTYTELIYRIVSQAQRGSESEEQANLDAYSIAEAMIPAIFQAVAEAAAGNNYKRPLLRRTKTVAFTNGTATIANDVLTKYLCDATLLDSANLAKRYSWVNDYGEFVRNMDARLGSFNSPIENTLAIREPGIAYTVGSGLTGNRLLTVPCVPEIPAGADDPVLVPDVIASDLVSVGAEMLRGRMAEEAAATT
jgi:hypothetical protein